MKQILVIDIGGTSVKLMMSRDDKRKFASGPEMTPRDFVRQVKKAAEGWEFDAVSIGFPSPVQNGFIKNDPKHLGKGWMDFNFSEALGKPLRVVNDAAMQALGSYHEGRMLFLGLGTGLGSALLWERNLLALELGDLPYPGTKRIEEVVGKDGFERLGKKAWQAETLKILRALKKALIADYVVVGGGNSKQLSELPEGFELGHNRNAYLGGTRLWQVDPKSKQPHWHVIS